MKYKHSFKKDLLTSVICTAVFGVVVGGIIACGGGNMATVIGTTPAALVHVITSRGASHRANFAAKGQTQHFAASLFAFFQTAPAPSVLAQPFARDCSVLTSVNTGPVGIIALDPNGNGSCLNVFTTPDATLVGPRIVRDGTINTLVVEAQTINPSSPNIVVSTLECDDLTSTGAVLNATATMAFLDSSTSTVNVYNNGTKLPNTCTLNVPAGQVLSHVTVSWTKG